MSSISILIALSIVAATIILIVIVGFFYNKGYENAQKEIKSEISAELIYMADWFEDSNKFSIQVGNCLYEAGSQLKNHGRFDVDALRKNVLGQTKPYYKKTEK